jgi:hypothetical protein
MFYFILNLKEGSFLLRKSSSGDPNHHPYSMSVLFKMQVYHLKIRRLDSLYTLGEPKTDEIVMLTFHYYPLYIFDLFFLTIFRCFIR